MNFIKLLPNIVTGIRLAGIPLLIGYMHGASGAELRYAAGFFLLLAITDAIDGILARRLNAESDLGKLLDPLVDKLLVMAPLIALVGFRSEVTGSPWVPSTLVILLIARELWVTGLRGVAASRGVVVAASELGKIKTVLQVVAVFFLILHTEKIVLISETWITAQYIGFQALIAALLIGYWGAFEYTVEVFRKPSKV